MKNDNDGNRLLPKSFTPSENDVVIAGRGDQRFQSLIQEHADEYKKDNASKKAIIDKVFDVVNENGSFVKKVRKTGRFYAMARSAKPVRDFISLAFRETKTTRVTRTCATMKNHSKSRRSTRHTRRNNTRSATREESNADGNDDDGIQVEVEEKEEDSGADTSVVGEATGKSTDRNDTDEPALPEEPMSPPVMNRTTTEVFDAIEPVLSDGAPSPQVILDMEEEQNPTETHDRLDETEPVQAVESPPDEITHDPMAGTADDNATLEAFGVGANEPVQHLLSSPMNHGSMADAGEECGSPTSHNTSNSPFESPTLSQLFAPMSPGMLRAFNLVEGSPMKRLSPIQTQTISLDFHEIDEQFAATMTVPTAINVNIDPPQESSFSQNTLSQETYDDHMSTDDLSMALSPFFLTGTPRRQAASGDQEMEDLLGFLSP